MEVWHASPKRIAGDLRVVPFDGKCKRGVPEDAEVVRQVRVFPDVLRIQHQVFPKRLLEAGVEFITPPGAKWFRDAGISLERALQSVYDWVSASRAGQHQVFVERSLQRASVRNAQHRVRRLDVVGDTNSRFRLAAA